MNTDSILVSVDLAGCAFEVATEAADLAKKLGAEVCLLYVTHLPAGVHAHDVLHTSRHPEGEDAQHALDEDAVQRLMPVLSVFEDLGVPVHWEIRHGDPVDAIFASREEHDHGLIILGTHGRTGLRRALMGSVAEKVVRRATVPVMTVRSLDLASHPGESAVEQQLDVEAMG